MFFSIFLTGFEGVKIHSMLNLRSLTRFVLELEVVQSHFGNNMLLKEDCMWKKINKKTSNYLKEIRNKK